MERHSSQAAFREFHQNNLQQWYRLLLRGSSFLSLDLHERVGLALLELCTDFGIAFAGHAFANCGQPGSSRESGGCFAAPRHRASGATGARWSADSSGSPAHRARGCAGSFHEPTDPGLTDQDPRLQRLPCANAKYEPSSETCTSRDEAAELSPV